MCPFMASSASNILDEFLIVTTDYEVIRVFLAEAHGTIIILIGIFDCGKSLTATAAVLLIHLILNWLIN